MLSHTLVTLDPHYRPHAIHTTPSQVGFTNQNAQGTIAPFPWRYVGIAWPDTPDATNVTNKREIFK